MPDVYSFRPDDDLAGEIDRRVGGLDGEEKKYHRATVLAGDLARYYGLLAREARELAGQFSHDEQLLLADAMNGWASRQEPESILLGGLLAGVTRYTILGAHVEDSIRMDGLAKKWAIDGPTLVAKLNRLSRAQVLALVDAVERFWADEERDTKGVL